MGPTPTGAREVKNYDVSGNIFLSMHEKFSKHEGLEFSKWFSEKMKRRIKQIDWDKAREDVRRFLPLKEQQNLDQWSQDFFLHLADRTSWHL